jgi:hypothetical protein
MTDGVKVICQSELTTDVELTFPEEVVRVMTSFVEDFKTIGRPINILSSFPHTIFFQGSASADNGY